MKEYYTYAYLREDGTPYYVGKGNKNQYRAYGRHRQGLTPKDRNRILILKSNLTEEEAFKHEIYMIAVFGRKDLGIGILHNKTDGGEGCRGIVITDEYIRNKSEAGKISKEVGAGIHGRTKEQMIEDGKKGAEKQKELGLGVVYGKTREELIKWGKICGNKTKELGIGIHGIRKEERVKNARKGGLIGGKNTSSQRWMCLETGHITNAGALTRYQRKRKIDTSQRVRVS